jgi:hypothetical protein
VIGNISGKGRSSVTIPAPTLYAANTFSVEVVSSDYTLSGSATAKIASHEPKILLYQDHPLFGLMHWNALGKQTSISESEMSFVAIPFFAPVTSLRDSALHYGWTINRTPIPADSEHPNEFTINSENSDGNAAIQLELTHESNFFLDSFGSWSIQMSSQQSNGASTQPSNAKDAFHQTTQ